MQQQRSLNSLNVYTDVFCMCVNVNKKTKKQEKEEKKIMMK